MSINEKLQQAATVADALAVSKRSKPETNYEALVLALVLAVTGIDEEKVNDVVVLAEGFAAGLPPDDVERAKRESLRICDEVGDLNPILVVAGFENRLHNMHPAYFPWNEDERLVDDARRAAALRGHGYFATDDSEWN